MADPREFEDDFEELDGGGALPPNGGPQGRPNGQDPHGTFTAGPQPSSVGVQQEKPWPELDPAAFHGLAGEVVSTIAPFTESDTAALLIQFLAFFGNVAGRHGYYLAESTKHFGNLNVLLVGQTSKARKGTSADRISHVFESVDLEWVQRKIHSGMSSGEGLLWPIRDPVFTVKKGIQELTDPGIEDKRMLILEPEFAGALDVMKRQGNLISRVIRYVWDCRSVVGNLTKHDRVTVTAPFVSIVGHITLKEVREKMTSTAMANGYANRFLFVCVRRSKLLPFGGVGLDKTTIETLGQKVAKVARFAQTLEQVDWSAEARPQWDAGYAELSKEGETLVDEMVARGEAQTARLAMIYAMLDEASEIGSEHLNAALAVWRFCKQSAGYIFSDATGTALADEIYDLIKSAGAAGVSNDQIYQHFKRNESSGAIHTALALLQRLKRVRTDKRATTSGKGRPRTMWYAI